MKSRLVDFALRVFRIWRLWIEPERIKMKRDVGSWLSDSPPETVVVEVGAGIEFIKPVLERSIQGMRYFGGDISPTSNTRAVFDVRAIPLPDASADVVLALEVLEHIPNPEAAVAEMSRILRPGGSMVLTVPFMFGVHDLMDYHRFTPLGMEQVLARHGLSITETKGRGGTFVSSTGLVRNLILNTIVGKPRDWRAQGHTKKLRWIAATVVLTPWTPITWTAYVLDSVLDRHSQSPPGYFFLITRDGTPETPEESAGRNDPISGGTDWYRAILRCPDDRAELRDSTNGSDHRALICTSCSREFPVEKGVPMLLPLEVG